jgi:hypothetical protein
MSIITFRALASRVSILSLALVLLAGVVASSAQAVTTGNLVVDPSFESNPLINFLLILGPPFTSGAWGAEAATITGGPVNGITPAAGSLMLSMTDDGNIATQAFQFVDVTAYTAIINAGLVTVDASALYNVPADIASGVSSVNVGFYNAAHSFMSAVNTGSNTLTGGFVDSNVSTWQSLDIIGAPVPVGTDYLLMQVAYGNASMVNPNGVSRPGYVDAASLTLTGVPEPSSIVLAALALLGALAMRKRR